MDEAFDLDADETFDAFYVRELPAIVRLAFALVGCRTVAEDLAQDAFFDAYRRWQQLGGYDKPGAWVRRCVLNRAVSARRRRAVQLRYLVGATRDVDRAESAPVRDEALWDEVRRLPRRQAQTVVLHYVEQRSTVEIAALLGISQASVKTHLQRARNTLAQRLEHDERPR